MPAVNLRLAIALIGAPPLALSVEHGSSSTTIFIVDLRCYRRKVVSDDFTAPFHGRRTRHSRCPVEARNGDGREVHDELGKENSYTTTLKQMQVMTEKGLLIRSERFGSHVYEAAAPQEQTQKQIAGDLLKRAFGGSARSLMMGALSAQPASREELDEIRKCWTPSSREGRSS